MELLAGDADAVGQARLDVHVHVFQVDAPVEAAGFDFRLDLLQAVDDRIALGVAQHADLGQHRGVGDGTHDVVAVETLVEVDGGGETGDEGVDGSLKRPPQDWLVSTLMVSLAATRNGQAARPA